jgi:small subunit ribosomal protein S9
MVEPKKYYQTVGRRKEAVARVRLYAAGGSGKVKVNKREFEEYFPRETDRIEAMRPFVATNTVGRYDMTAIVCGGGVSGQADAMKLAIARALEKDDPSMRGTLKKAGFLTSDSRIKERKKYGRKRARKRFQFSKR